MISKEHLLDEKYYIKYLPMLLRDSYGFVEQLSYFVNILQQIDFVCDQYINALDLYNITWNEDNPWVINNIKETYPGYKPVKFTNYIEFLDYFGEEEFLLLDFIASLVGVSRDVVYTYNGISGETKETIHLNNKELYRYILVSIAKNNYDGSREAIQKAYKPFIDNEIIRSIDYNTQGNCEVQIQIVYYKGISDNEYIMFKSGNYLIKSLGINYSVQLIETKKNIFKFNSNNTLDTLDIVI